MLPQFVYDGKKPPTPYPTYKDKWDNFHVRMPCSNQSEYPVHTKVGHHLDGQCIEVWGLS